MSSLQSGADKWAGIDQVDYLSSIGPPGILFCGGLPPFRPTTHKSRYKLVVVSSQVTLTFRLWGFRLQSLANCCSVLVLGPTISFYCSVTCIGGLYAFIYIA